MVRIHGVYNIQPNDNDFIFRAGEITKVQPAAIDSFPEVKSIIYYRHNQRWLYSTEEADVINQRIRENSHATATH